MRLAKILFHNPFLEISGNKWKYCNSARVNCWKSWTFCWNIGQYFFRFIKQPKNKESVTRSSAANNRSSQRWYSCNQSSSYLILNSNFYLTEHFNTFGNMEVQESNEEEDLKNENVMNEVLPTPTPNLELDKSIHIQEASLNIFDNVEQTDAESVSKQEENLFENSFLNLFPNIDDIGIEFGSSKKSKKFKKKSKKANRTKEKLAPGSSNEDKPKRVNHFVAIQVSNKQILDQVRIIQEKILASPLPLALPIIRKQKQHPKNRDYKKESTEVDLSDGNDKNEPKSTDTETAEIFKDAMERLESLHFTVSVIGLHNDQDVINAKIALQNCWSKHRTSIEENPMHLDVLGLGHFGNKVLFAGIKNEEHIARLSNLAEDLRIEFDKLNVFQASTPFKAHMTIAKMSRSKTLWKNKIRTFPPEIWTDFQLHYFGQQPFENIQLLAMSRDETTKYYKLIANYGLNNDGDSQSRIKNDNGDSSESDCTN